MYSDSTTIETWSYTLPLKSICAFEYFAIILLINEKNVREIAESLNISVMPFTHDILGMHHVATRLVPKSLNFSQKKSIVREWPKKWFLWTSQTSKTLLRMMKTRFTSMTSKPVNNHRNSTFQISLLNPKNTLKPLKNKNSKLEVLYIKNLFKRAKQ